MNRYSPCVTVYRFVSVLYMSNKKSAEFKRINQLAQEGIN